MWKKALVFAVVTFVVVAAGSARTPSLPEPVLEQAFENGCSLAIVKILSARADEKAHYYKVNVVRTIVAGDLEREEVERQIELSAGASAGDVLKQGVCYALLISHPFPNDFIWDYWDNIIQLDPSDKEATKQLIGVVDRIYARTVISRFRRASMEPAAKLPDLPEELLSLCKQFRERPAERGGIAQRIAESDVGSLPDKSLPPKISCSREEIISLLGYPTLKAGRAYYWSAGSSPQGGTLVGVLSVGFDPNGRSTGLTYTMQEQSKWARPSRPVNFVAEAGGDPAGVARSFQQALKDADWSRALSYCSPSVQVKAKESESPEAFFRQCVPVKELILKPFKPRAFSSRGGKTVAMSDEIAVLASETNLDPITWAWTLRKAGTDWQVDFAPIPLDRHILKEQTKREARNRRGAANQEAAYSAIKYVLSPIGEEFVIGQPMLFRLEMKNEGTTPVAFRRTSLMVNDAMRVVRPDGKDRFGEKRTCPDTVSFGRG